MATVRDAPIPRNASTRVFVIVLGTLIGLSGVAHGVFEIMQGNQPTDGILLPGIGAVTLIQNFLLTGIAAVALGLALVAWTIGCIHRRQGPAVFLILSVLLLLAGGGIAQLPAFLLAFAVATRVNAPLSWWHRTLSPATRRFLARAWLQALLAGLMVLIIGVVMWLTALPPGEPQAITPLHYVLWSILLAGFVLLAFALVSGFARDIELDVSRRRRDALL